MQVECSGFAGQEWPLIASEIDVDNDGKVPPATHLPATLPSSVGRQSIAVSR